MYNKVFLVGNLTRDPELRYTPSGIPVCRFTLAINRPPQRGQDSSQRTADFLNIVAWRRLAEICGEFLHKGSPLFAEGRLQIRPYEKEGKKRTMSEIILDNMQMLGKKNEAAKELAPTSPLSDQNDDHHDLEHYTEESPF